MQNVLGEIQIIVGKCTTHIIIHLVSALRYLLELGNNDVIAALSAAERTHLVVDLLTSIDTQHDITHFLIHELQDLII